MPCCIVHMLTKLSRGLPSSFYLKLKHLLLPSTFTIQNVILTALAKCKMFWPLLAYLVTFIRQFDDPIHRLSFSLPLDAQTEFLSSSLGTEQAQQNAIRRCLCLA